MTLALTEFDLVDPATQRTLAGRGARLGAILIDAAFFGGVNLLPSPIGTGCFVLLAIVNLWGVLMHGQTIGKCALKIAIAEQETNLPPGYMRAAIIRSGPQTVLSMVFPVAALAYIVIDGLFIFSKSRQCLHDRLARTVVIVGSREWWTRSPTDAGDTPQTFTN
jgi:uncharacterized RDD family membrane protein YckC